MLCAPVRNASCFLDLLIVLAAQELSAYIHLPYFAGRDLFSWLETHKPSIERLRSVLHEVHHQYIAVVTDQFHLFLTVQKTTHVCSAAVVEYMIS